MYTLCDPAGPILGTRPQNSKFPRSAEAPAQRKVAWGRHCHLEDGSDDRKIAVHIPKKLTANGAAT